MSIYPVYEDTDSLETRLIKCIDFEFSRGGSSRAVAKSIVREALLGRFDVSHHGSLRLSQVIRAMGDGKSQT